MPAKVPSPEELRMQEKQKEIRTNSELAVAVDNMPEKRRKLLIAMLTFPDRSDRELLKLAGIRGVTKDSVFKEVGGKLSQTLKSFGITQADIARNLHQCLNATKTVKTRTPIYDENGEVTGWAHGVEHIPDFNTRLKATEMIAKLGDYFPATKTKGKLEIDVGHHLTPQTQALLEDRERRQIDAQYEEIDAIN